MLVRREREAKRPTFAVAVPMDFGREAAARTAKGEALNEMEVEAIIPSKSNPKQPIEFDCEAYKRRNLIERMFNKLKYWRRIATRYDKTASSFLAFIMIASAKLWMPFVHDA